MKIIASNNSNPSEMLKELARELKGKGQIQADYTALSPKKDGVGRSVKVSFGSLPAIDRLLSRVGLGSAKIKRDGAFDQISELISTSNLPKGDLLLKSIGRVMQTTGKLRGEDVARQIAIYLKAMNADNKTSTPTQMPSGSVPTLSSVNDAASPIPFQTKGGKLAPGSAGLHFVRDHPLALDATRIIVPTSMALRAGVSATGENYVSTLPGLNGNSYVISMEDRPSKISDVSGDKTIRERFESLLAHCVGTVVISPVAFDKQSLQHMLEAASAACKSNRNLSVTFAVPDKFDHEKLDQAYRLLNPALKKSS